ncbi:Hexokinase-2 [Dirofilaria immitis]
MLLELASSFANQFGKGYGIFENGDGRLPLNRRDLENRRQIDEICRSLMLSDDDLKQVMSNLLKAMEKGLDSKTAPLAAVKMLPSFVRAVPNGTEIGNFLALDLGGTNFRVLLIKLDGRDAEMTGTIFRVPDNVMRGTGEALFDHIAECMARFMEEKDIKNSGKLPLGFTFSFPCRQEGLTCAKLINWTKGFSASDVENKDVVTLLREACQRRKDIDIDVVAVLNDTVGTLMACAFKENTCQIGVIVGTGSNACYMEKIKNCDKLKDMHLEEDGMPDEMIINTEWGAFGDDGTLEFLRTRFDREVDEQTINPGKQLFEKMISGMYMGELVRVILAHLAHKNLLFNGDYEAISKPHSFPTKFVSEVEREIMEDEEQNFSKTMQILEEIGTEQVSVADCINVAYVCSLVSTRAAHLCAAGIATLLNRMQKPFVTVGVDGSVYRFHPTFPRLLDEKIEQLVDKKLKYQLMLSEDGSGRGAALVAAVASRIRNENCSQTPDN